MDIISGIYSITNKINGKIYIGSSKNIYCRKTQHYSELRGRYHENIFLQRSWNKYGEENFVFNLIEEVSDVTKLYEREQYYIDKYFDKEEKCYNLNPVASKPPLFRIPCAVYDRDGNFLQKFDSVKEANEFMGVSLEHALCENTLINNSFMIRKITSENISKKIEGYKQRNFREIYLLDNDNNIIEIFYDIPSLSYYFNKKKDKKEETKIAHCLHVIHKYKNHMVIYKDDYDKFNGFPNFDFKIRKYILKFDFKGNLVDIIENKYGLKFTKNEVNNCKINTRLFLLDRESLRVYDEKYVYLRSDCVISHIRTGITTYVYENVKTKETKEFLKRKYLLEEIGITKSLYDFYFKSNKLYKDTYKLIKLTY